VSDDWIASRLAALFADDRGVVRDGYLLQDYAVRIALLIDLALRGRVRFDVDRNYVDTSPTGFVPADALLEDIVRNPHRSIAELFATASVRMIDVVDPRVGESRRRRRRAVTLDRDFVVQVKDEVRAVATTGAADPAASAALAVLAGVLGLALSDHRASLIARCGQARYLLTDCCTYLSQLMDKFALISEMRSPS
jgi:Golgi phosphoprotein 3 (GPP34)